MRTLKKKSISIMLVFTLLMTVFMPITVSARTRPINTLDSGNGLNMSIDSNGILDWDNVPGATGYTVTLTKPNFTHLYSWDTTNSAFALISSIDQLKYNSGQYTIGVSAKGVSASDYISYYYTSNVDQLEPPNGLYWDGDTANWSAVDGASIYFVELNDFDGRVTLLSTNSTSLDFSGFYPEDGWTFRVQAAQSNSGTLSAKRDSLFIESPAYEGGSITTYTCSFNSNGGTGTMADVTGLTGTYTLPANGFTAPANKQFKGWSLTSDGAIITSVEMTTDRTIYAIWEDIPATLINEVSATVTAPVGGEHPSFTVTIPDGAHYTAVVDTWYDLDNNGAHLTNSDTFVTDNEYQVRIHFTANTGYEIANGASYTINGTPNYSTFDTAKQRGMIFVATAPAVTTYTVTYDANGGTGSMASVNNVSGNYTLPPNGFTPPANKQFECWSVNGNEKNPFESISVTADVTVKAVWKDIVTTSYTVSFDSNGGSGSMASVTNAPSLYTLPANGFTPPANKQFKCWAVGAQNDEYDPGDKITITANVTVKAVWEAITSSRQVISDVVATSSDLDTIPTLYGLLKIPTFTVTQGAPAYINASTSNLRWQKKVGGVWTNQDSGRFTPGEWRISSSLRIDGTDGYYYELGNPTTLTVNGQAWTVENGGKPSVHPDYSYASIYSPVFTIVDDPNVQPPVSVPSVHMVLKGYEKGALISAASVQTDAMVDVDVLGFLKLVDSNGDGEPEPEVAGNNDVFEEGVLYAVAISLHAKDGYDISELTPATVSLDRSLMDSAEEFVEDDETFNGIYLLDDMNQWTVKFETNGGSSIAPEKVSNGKTVTPPADPTRAYYAFDGWYSDSNLTQAFDFNTPISTDITLYAKWTPSPVGGMFLMTIDFNGGTSTIPSSSEIPVGSEVYFETGETIQSVVTPPSGKVFDAYEIDGVRYEHGDEYYVTQNFTLKFLWKDAPVTTYTVSFNANGGSGTMADVTGISGEYTLPSNSFTAPDGKQFKAWSVGSVEKAVGDKITVTADTTVTAVWENIPVTYYTVTFDSNGGSAVTAQTIEAGQKATKPADPTKDGYDFKGWTLNGSAYDFNTAVNGNITLVATWEQQQVVPTTYTVSFAANGGTGTMADVTGISGEYTLPENGFTAPAGKQFKAWSVGGVEKAVGDKITATADTTVTAVWETIPAGHTCDIKPAQKVDPSCAEGGKEAYYKCEGCGKFYEDALGAKEITDLAAWGNIAKNGHTESDWKSDKDNHWKECTVAACGVIIENSKAAHADANKDGKCDTCEYNVGTTTTNPDNKPLDDTTKPEDTNKPSDDVQSLKTGDNSMMWLWVALLFVSGFGVVATTVIGKKKSSAK